MTINKTTFFAYARKAPFGGKLTTSQVQGTELIIDAFFREGGKRLSWLANILAQVFHETGGRMVPVRETFAATDAEAIKRLNAAFKAGKLSSVKTPYWREGFFGRGPIQVTHKENYVKMGKRLVLDLVANPDLLLEPDVGARSAVVGMMDGMFAADKKGPHNLARYFPDAGAGDPKGARRIVNGQDKASLIASYHKNFLDALEAADTATPQPVDVVKEDAKPDDVPPAESKSVWAIVTTFLGGMTSLPFLGNVNNGFALGALALIIVAAGIGAWLVLSGRITINRAKAITP